MPRMPSSPSARWSKDLDLRGLEAVSYLDPASLRGATLSPRQVEYLAPALAEALGIRVLDGRSDRRAEGVATPEDAQTAVRPQGRANPHEVPRAR
jgi:hypothetical protein